MKTLYWISILKFYPFAATFTKTCYPLPNFAIIIMKKVFYTFLCFAFLLQMFPLQGFHRVAGIMSKPSFGGHCVTSQKPSSPTNVICCKSKLPESDDSQKSDTENGHSDCCNRLTCINICCKLMTPLYDNIEIATHNFMTRKSLFFFFNEAKLPNPFIGMMSPPPDYI